MAPRAANPESPEASTLTTKAYESNTASPQPDSRVTFVNAAHAARSRTNNEIRQMDNIMEIVSDHSSAEDEIVANRHVKANIPATGNTGNTEPKITADIEPQLVLDSPSTRHIESSESIARKVEGFAQPYKRPTFLSSPASTNQPNTCESIFDTVAKSPVSSLKIVDRMRPKSGSSGHHSIKQNSKGSTKDASSPPFSTAKAQSQSVEEFIEGFRSPVAKNPAAATFQSLESKPKKSPKTSRRRTVAAANHTKLQTPPKKMPLKGVQIGKHIQLAGSLANHLSNTNLGVRIKYIQRGLEIHGLNNGDDYMKIDSSDIGLIEQRVNGDIAVIKVVPTDTIESVFESNIFNPSSTDPNLRDIYLVFHLTSKGDQTAIERLVNSFKEDIYITSLDQAVFTKYARELTKPPSIDLTPSSDEEDTPKASTALATTDSSTVSHTSPYWSSINTDVETRMPLRESQKGINPDKAQDDAIIASKQTKLPGSENKQRLRDGAQFYGLRRVAEKLSTAHDNDDDDFIPQYKEFCLTDHTLRFEYPQGGPKSISVTGSDICRLYEGEFLNDTILEFYIRYIDENLRIDNPSLHQKCFFFNTFFFRKLSQRNRPVNTSSESDPMEAIYRQLKRWTANVELFDKHYIFVPINENTHWYLAIIVNSKASLGDFKAEASPDLARVPPEGQDVNISSRETDTKMAIKTDAKFFGDVPETSKSQDSTKQVNSNTIDLSNSDVRSDPDLSLELQAKPDFLTINFAGKTFEVPATRYVDPDDTPSIVILDSLGNRHQPTFGLLRGYMRAEAKSRHDLELDEMPHVGKYAKMPLQNNFCDCGVYLLQYIEEFLKDPPAFMALALGGVSMRNLFTSGQMQQKRLDMLHLATRLVNEQKAVEKTEGI
ncbi:hypothetical protein IWW36_004166 [Coemansia brasiliensis]|uniref:Ubiquitin-like protease family profile domain-containing protein n=1 Tax=Coemansia brasiliensis TaxID=2650707 RepID=A0A9W8I6F6_9FUNG|nr:hypothetical protein IWW36_004166 [Coemansia brasiliensis]